MDYPAGIDANGSGLRIRLFSKGRCIYSETVTCDPLSAQAVQSASKRRDWLLARQKLGLPLYDDGDYGQTLESAAEEYLELYTGKASSRNSVRSHVDVWWKGLKHLPIHEIDDRQILREMNKRKGPGGKTRKNALSSLSAIMNFAKVHPNPCDEIEIKVQKKRIQRYLPEQRQQILDEMSGQFKVYFAVFFGCGLRTGEILGLTWADYDGEQLWIDKQMVRRVADDETKTHTCRWVYVPTWVRSILEEHDTRDVGGHIFQQATKPGEPHKDAREFNKAWKAAHKALGLTWRRAYTCRHTRAAELLSTGVAPAEAALQLGHSVETFLRIYSEVMGEWMPDQDKARFEGITVEKLSSGDAKNTKVLNLNAKRWGG